MQISDYFGSIHIYTTYDGLAAVYVVPALNKIRTLVLHHRHGVSLNNTVVYFNLS